jgi:hypothetical protein
MAVASPRSPGRVSTPRVSSASSCCREPSGWALRGIIVLVHDSVPFEARYEVSCDLAWVTSAVAVNVRLRGTIISARRS